MKIQAIKTSLFHKGQALDEFVFQWAGSHIKAASVLAVTSKIVSLAENRTVAKDSISKIELVRKESDHYLGELGHGCHLTIKDGLFIPSAGIDESNSESGDYILFPRDAYLSARNLHASLANRLNHGNFGILITDSHTTPLRKGVTGIALAYWGFKGLCNLVGQRDLFGRKLQMTQQNIADSLASAAVLLMGEGADTCPLAIMDGAPIELSDTTEASEISIELKNDLYYPIYQHLISSTD